MLADSLKLAFFVSSRLHYIPAQEYRETVGMNVTTLKYSGSLFSLPDENACESFVAGGLPSKSIFETNHDCRADREAV